MKYSIKLVTESKTLILSLLGIFLLIAASISFYLIGVSWVSLFLAGFELFLFLGVFFLLNSLERKAKSEEVTSTNEYKKLEKCFNKLNIPLPEQINKLTNGEPVIALFDEASADVISLLRQGSKKSDNLFLVLEPSWLISKISDNKTRLLLQKGVTFLDTNKAVLVNYESPESVRYFANMTYLNENIHFDKCLTVPIAGSKVLKSISNEKLISRYVLNKESIDVPDTLAFLFSNHYLYDKIDKEVNFSNKICLLPFPDHSENITTEVYLAVEKFLEFHDGDDFVIKPSGSAFHSAYGIKFFKKHEIIQMAEHIIALSFSPHMNTKNAIILDSRIKPPPLYIKLGEVQDDRSCFVYNQSFPMHIMSIEEFPTATPFNKYDWNLRIFISRSLSSESGCKVTGILVHGGPWGFPITTSEKYIDKASVIFKYEDLIYALSEQYDLFETNEDRRKLTERLEAIGKNCFNAIDKFEKELLTTLNEKMLAETDYLGIDLIFTEIDGKIYLKVLEINDHYMGGQYYLDKFYPEHAGEQWNAWLETMYSKSTNLTK